MESKEAEEEFAMIPDGWRLKKQINLPEFNLENKIEDVPEGWKFRFKQPKIHQFFKSRELIDFDKEMEKVEQEWLLEKKMNGWKGREKRKEERQISWQEILWKL